jgi:hypothetical protein
MIGGWNALGHDEVDALLDRMEQASVRRLAFGGALPIEPDARHYTDTELTPVEPPAETMQKQSQIRSLFSAVRERGMEIYIYGTNPHSGGGSRQVYGQLACKHVLDADGTARPVDSYWGACVNGAQFLPYHLGRIRDAYHHFPEVSGFLNDGPEFGYEIAPGLMGDNWSVFSCFGPCCEQRANAVGHDLAASRLATLALHEALRSLDAERVEEAITSPAGLPETLAVIADAPAIAEWLAFKSDAVVAYTQALCDGVRQIDASLQVGIGSRLPAFTPLTGSDLSRLARHADFVLPKIYLWMGGYDGLYGTIYRWTRTLAEWNASLSESLLVRLVFKLFGFALPGVKCLADMERHLDPADLEAVEVGAVTRLTREGDPFPERFFDEVVVDQVETMVAQAGDPWRVRPWVGTSHGGRIMTPGELDQLLTAGERGGLQTYMYYGAPDGEEWAQAVGHARS